MDSQSPLSRARLRATAEGRVDPALIVDESLHELDDLLGFVEQGIPLDAAGWGELLSLYGRLRRVRPELYDAEACESLAQAESRCRSATDRDVSSAVAAVADGLVDWPARLVEFDRVGEFVVDHEQIVARREIAVELLNELDDAELLVAVVGDGPDIWPLAPGPDWESVDTSPLVAACETCRSLLSRYSARFLEASVWIQAVAQSFQVRLATSGGLLGSTVDKFVALLNAAEDQESFLLGQVRSPRWQRFAAEWLKTDSGLPSAAARSRPKWLPEVVTYQAAAASDAPFAFLPDVEWDAPDRVFFARLVIPSRVHQSDYLRLVVLSSTTSEAAVELHGREIRLCGRLLDWSAQGFWKVPVQWLCEWQNAGVQELSLTVGSVQSRWQQRT